MFIFSFLFFVLCSTNCLFLILVQGVGVVTLHFLLCHGKASVYQELNTMIRMHQPNRVSYVSVKPFILKYQEDVFNWVVFNLNYTTKHGCKSIMFERTLVAHRRGLSREGREIMASHGCLMKRTLYDSTLKNFLSDMTTSQR